jgi:hypothetical protein
VHKKCDCYITQASGCRSSRSNVYMAAFIAKGQRAGHKAPESGRHWRARLLPAFIAALLLLLVYVASYSRWAWPSNAAIVALHEPPAGAGGTPRPGVCALLGYILI